MFDAIKEEIATAINEQGADKSGLLGWLQRIANGVQKEKHEEHLDWTLDGAGIDSISAKTTNGSINFTVSEGTQILVKAHKVVKAPDRETAQSFSQQVQTRVEQEAQSVQIFVEYPKPPRGVSVAVSFDITAPPTVAITGKTTNGEARVESFRSSVDLESTNGSVHVTEVTGRVRAQTTNGDVRLRALTGSVEAKTTNGSVKANDITIAEAANFASHNGDVRATITAGSAPITATTHNGSVRMIVPTDYAGLVEARTHNGRVQSMLPVQITERSRTRLARRIGDGSDTPAILRSHNGNVTLAGPDQVEAVA